MKLKWVKKNIWLGAIGKDRTYSIDIEKKGVHHFHFKKRNYYPSYVGRFKNISIVKEIAQLMEDNLK